MELFITNQEIKVADTQTQTTQARDTEGDNMQAFCEICYQFDNVFHLMMFHNLTQNMEHTAAHERCVRESVDFQIYDLCRC